MVKSPPNPKAPPPLSDDDLQALQEIIEGDGLPRELGRRAIRAWQGVTGVKGRVNELSVLKQVPPQLARVIRSGQWGTLATVLEKLVPNQGDSEAMDDATKQGLELVRMAAEDSRSSAVVVQSHYARVSETRREEVVRKTGRPIPKIRDMDQKSLTSAPDALQAGLAGLAKPSGGKKSR